LFNVNEGNTNLILICIENAVLFTFTKQAYIITIKIKEKK